ncbi:MAG TPA: tetratricopeptide repeat protein [Pyrinomonadaceae bacterium]
MRTECRRSLFYTTLLSALLAVSFSLAACSNPEKTKAAHLAKGETYLKDQKFQEASIEFRNALQIDDKLAAAHWGLAQAFEGLQRWPEMFEELRRTVELDKNNFDARIKLGNMYVAGSKRNADLLNEAERLVNEILDKNPNHIEAHILKGSIRFAQNKRDEALQELNKAIELDPKRVESYLGLARYYVVMQDQTKALETFKRAIDINSASPVAHTEYGKFLVQLGKKDEAEGEFKKAVEVDPKDKGARFVLASFYLVNKQFDKAEEAYKALADLDKDQPQSQAVLADFYALANRPDDAVNVYKNILAKSPEYIQARYRIAEILMSKGDLQSASTQLEDVLKKDPHDRQALLLRARLHAQGNQNDYRSAIEDLKEVLRQEPNSRAGLYTMSQVNFNMGLIEQARNFASDLEKNYPDYLPAKLLQVQINIGAGDPKSAVRLASNLLDRLDKTAPDRETTPELISEMRTKAYVSRGIAQAQLKNYDAARQDFMAAREIRPQDTDVYNNLAGLALAEKKLDEAATFYETSLSNDATNYNALSGLTNLYAQQGQFDKAHERVDRAIQSYPNNASLHFIKAQIYGYQRNAQGAETELSKTLELDANYINAYYSLAALYINSHQEERAIAEYRKVLERTPDSSGAYTLIGMLEDSRKNYDGAIQSYKKALELDQSAAIAANNLAWLYAVNEKGNLDEAVRLAQGVVQKSPNVAGFVDTLGWVYYKKGLYGAAVEQLQKAVDLDATTAKNAGGQASPNYPYHLGVALKAKGDRDGARRQLEAALRLGEKVPFAESEEARKALATL